VSEKATIGPPGTIRFRRRLQLGRSLVELFGSRELIRSLAEREFRARYKQAVLGIAWAVLTPLALMAVFTLFFSRVARVDTGGVPYPLFAYLGLLPWMFFSTSVNQGGQSLVQNIPLLNKVYFPREVFPLASVVVAGMDGLVALSALALLFVVNGTAPQVTSYWVPLLLLVQVAFTLGVTLVVAAIVVYLRDLRHALPIILQLGLFATPVAYGIDVVPASLQVLYSIINPLAPVIDGYRRCVLLGLPPNGDLLVPGAIAAVVWLVGGYMLFKRMETGFADVA
jgi:ABC-type polysaccharide/polyol phosphate export permease